MGMHGEFVNDLAGMRIFPDLIPQEEFDTAMIEAESRKSKKLSKESQRQSAQAAAENAKLSQVRATTLSIMTLHNHGELFVNFLKARNETFIKAKKWDLSEVDGMEFDQYDTPRARWIVLHEYGQVLGGVRLTPTTSTCAHYSYMIRDAQLGVIETIPRDVLFFKAPVDPRIWEATRLFLSPDISADRRLDIQRILLEKMASTASELGATHIIGIVPAVFSRWMTRLGIMSAVQVGPVMEIDGDRTQAALMSVASTRRPATD
tara:strand:- start:595 stop:1380 length:786 start_codon:yes stop_codon:yes gene_type:complete